MTNSTNKYCVYELLKLRWLEENPVHTAKEYEQAVRKIAEGLGI